MLELKLFPNAKEITESFGCFNATIDALGGMDVCKREDITYIIVGDGSTPRTAALFALRTKGKVICFDPQLRHEDWGIDRLICHKGKAEDFKEKHENDLVLIFPHSHANTRKVLSTHTVDSEKHKRTVVWLPCCTEVGLNEKAISFVDTRIASPKNRFYVWENI